MHNRMQARYERSLRIADRYRTKPCKGDMMSNRMHDAAPAALAGDVSIIPIRKFRFASHTVTHNITPAAFLKQR